jgi:hypothetical protein
MPEPTVQQSAVARLTRLAALAERGGIEIQPDDIADMLAVLAEHERLTAQAARFDAEWALQVDGLTVASGSEEFVREGGFDHSSPGHAIVRRLVGPWCEVEAADPDTESGAA